MAIQKAVGRQLFATLQALQKDLKGGVEGLCVNGIQAFAQRGIFGDRLDGKQRFQVATLQRIVHAALKGKQ